jgi:hypothetical protein
MQPIQQVFEDAPATVDIPPELQHHRLKVIFLPLEDRAEKIEGELDANGWPVGFFEQTFGSIPDFPERESQGEYEEREPLE